MDELRDLLAMWNDADQRASMTDEQLARLEELLVARSVELYDGNGTPDDETLQELDEIAETVEAVRAEISTRDEAAEGRAEQANGLLERIRGQEGDDGGDGEDDDGEADGDAGDEEASDTGPEEGDEGGDSGDADGGEAGDEEGSDALPIAAAPASPRRSRIGRVAARRPATAWNTPQPTGRRHLSLVASANAGDGIRAGQPLDDPRDLSEAFLNAWAASDGYEGPRRKISVGFAGARRVEDLYPEAEILGRDPMLNAQRIRARTSRDAIVANRTAAGGRCVPSEVRYDLPALVGTEERPVRDDMAVRYGADRGGVVTLAPMVLTDVSDAIGVWTEANDQNPTSPTTKPCLTVDCPDDDESVVDAITRCLQFGNFRSRYFGEQIQEVTDLAAVAHARIADARALSQIGSGSTQITVGQVYGTTRTVLDAVARAVSQIRDRHRLPDSFPFRFGVPRWLLNNIRVDLARQMPVGTLDETLAVADAAIVGWIEQYGVNFTPLLDDENGATWGPQGDGALDAWPSNAITYLYPEGTWLFLDGGMLDFGIVRDSTLNSTNDFQVFMETFEGTHFHGVESYRMDIDICPDGTAAALDDQSPCTTGS